MERETHKNPLEHISDEELQQMYLVAELEAETAANYVQELMIELMRRVDED